MIKNTSKQSYIVDNVERIINSKGLKKRYVAERAGIPARKFSDMLNGRLLNKSRGYPSVSSSIRSHAKSIVGYFFD